jgi:hypothetical protein
VVSKTAWPLTTGSSTGVPASTVKAT